jgi:hypothetical protein
MHQVFAAAASQLFVRMRKFIFNGTTHYLVPGELREVRDGMIHPDANLCACFHQSFVLRQGCNCYYSQRPPVNGQVINYGPI